MDVSERIYALLAPVVETMDVELLDVEFNGGTLRVIVDDLPAEDRVGAEATSEAASPETDGSETDGAETDLPESTSAASDGEVADPKDEVEVPVYKGITMDRVAAVNRLVSPILDQHDPIPGRYTLEVSSPGLERPLRRPAHYRQAIGEDVVVKMERHLTPRRLRGRLSACDAANGAAAGDTAQSDTAQSDTAQSDTATTISLEVVEIDGVELSEVEEREIALIDVDSARTVFVWGPSPKPGKPGAKKPGQPGSKKSGGKSKKKKQNKKSSSQPRGSR